MVAVSPPKPDYHTFVSYFLIFLFSNVYHSHVFVLKL